MLLPEVWVITGRLAKVQHDLRELRIRMPNERHRPPRMLLNHAQITRVDSIRMSLVRTTSATPPKVAVNVTKERKGLDNCRSLGALMSCGLKFAELVRRIVRFGVVIGRPKSS